MTCRSVSQLAPKLFRLAPAQFSPDWFVLSEMRGPIYFGRFLRPGRRERGKGLAVPSDGDLLAMLNPFGQAGKIISQVANRRCLHL